MNHKPIPQHVVEQREAVKEKLPRKQKQHAELHDVFQRINMHNGDVDVCWEWKGAHGKGTRGEYRPRVVIGQKDYYVYRIVYELYTGYKLRSSEVVRHKCDNCWCCNPTHMIIGTQADNVADMIKRERVGMKHYQIRRIMQMLEIGCDAAFISAKMREGYDLQIDASVIRKIRMRVIYKHIEWPWGDAYATIRRRRLDDLKKSRLASDPTSAIINDTTNTTQGDTSDASKDKASGS